MQEARVRAGPNDATDRSLVGPARSAFLAPLGLCQGGYDGAAELRPCDDDGSRSSGGRRSQAPPIASEPPWASTTASTVRSAPHHPPSCRREHGWCRGQDENGNRCSPRTAGWIRGSSPGQATTHSLTTTADEVRQQSCRSAGQRRDRKESQTQRRASKCGQVRTHHLAWSGGAGPMVGALAWSGRAALPAPALASAVSSHRARRSLDIRRSTSTPTPTPDASPLSLSSTCHRCGVALTPSWPPWTTVTAAVVARSR